MEKKWNMLLTSSSIQGWGAFVKMTQLLLRLRISSFHEHGSGSSPVAFGLNEYSSGSNFGFCSFSHINIFNCFGPPQVERNMNSIKYTKLR